jgi:hypothetical protein
LQAKVPAKVQRTRDVARSMADPHMDSFIIFMIPAIAQMGWASIRSRKIIQCVRV